MLTAETSKPISHFISQGVAEKELQAEADVTVRVSMLPRL